MIEPRLLSDVLRASLLLRAAPSWTLFTHQNADGDAVGSTSGLFEAGRLAGKRVSWFGLDDRLPPVYAFLAHTEEYRRWEEKFSSQEELYVFLDCSNEARSVQAPEGARIVNIDHHEDNSRFGTVNCVDPASSSTSELVFLLLKAGEWPLSQRLAESLYTGIWTDSGGFAFSNTSPRTHRLAAELLELGVDPSRLNDRITQTRTPQGMALWARALSRVRLFGPGGVFALAWLAWGDLAATGASESDVEGLASSLMRLRGVRFAMFLRELESGEVKASFRSREGIFEAAEAARALGGGGHPRAAGATLQGPLEDRIAEISQRLEQRYAEWTSAR